MQKTRPQDHYMEEESCLPLLRTIFAVRCKSREPRFWEVTNYPDLIAQPRSAY